ncbi:MAG: MBL fold metallo-hydrolase [Deltaproteobacteria bacterium]|nr:MBL fold metallo-hydrolase [Deltaproteobacteria bacterium]MCL4873731.1 MBL fold metallo-hydrolase [bacterium]
MDFGRFRIFSLSDGSFRLDGGAMFGVAPKALWEPLCPPDEKNRIPLSIRPLLIQTGSENVLVDTGIGDKGDARFRSVYAVDRGRTLSGSLESIGLSPSDIDIVINTHLHFDHAGGNTVREGGALRTAFPNARYIVQRGEWEAAGNPNERTRGSYCPDDFLPLMEAGQLELIEGDGEVASGVSVIRTGGHNRDNQIVSVRSEGMTAVFTGDLIPTTRHLRLPFITAYDLFPLDTLKVKKEILSEAAENRWLLIFEHDPAVEMGYVRFIGKDPVLEIVPQCTKPPET